MRGALASFFYAVALIAAVAGIMTLCSRCGGCRSSPEEVARYDTVRAVVYDTVTVERPAPVSVAQLPDVVRRLPRWIACANKNAQSDSVLSIAVDLSANKHAYIDSLADCVDSADVVVPMERRVYTDSVNYRAVITGAWVSLDTIAVYPRREIVTIKQPPDRPKRWAIGPVVAYGWAGRWTPFVGVGVTYNLIRL